MSTLSWVLVCIEASAQKRIDVCLLIAALAKSHLFNQVLGLGEWLGAALSNQQVQGETGTFIVAARLGLLA